VQWTRLPAGANANAFVERVRHLLSGELPHEPTRTTSVASRASAVPTTRGHVLTSWRPRVALLVTIALVVLALGYVVTNRYVLSKRFAGVGALPAPTDQSAPAIAFNPPPHSIAVLPFVNMSGNQEQEYFADGVTEELLDTLSRVDQLQVAARTSSFSFRGQTADTATIARKLNVGALLEGSVRRAGRTVRITVQLINAMSGFHIWSQTYDRNLSNILAVQREVATAVAQQLKVKLGGEDIAKLDAGGTTNPDAYDAYLRGEHLYNAGLSGPEPWRKVLAYFDRAIALDPNYAAAYTGRARAYGHEVIFVAPPEQRAALRTKSLAAAERAVALAPGWGEAHSVLATTRAYVMMDFRGAAPEHERALVLAPGSAQVQRRYGSFVGTLGHFDRAIGALRRAASLDPQNFLVHEALGQALHMARRYDEAIEEFHAAAALAADPKALGGNVIETLLDAGDNDQARSLCESPATPLDDDDRASCLARAYHALGRVDDAQREMSKHQALRSERSPYSYARIYACWGEVAEALRWLERAEQQADPEFQSFRVDKCLDIIRQEPRFKAIEARLNFPP